MSFGWWEQQQPSVAAHSTFPQLNLSISTPSCSVSFSQDQWTNCMCPTVPVTPANINATGTIWPVGVYNLCPCANSQESRILLFIGAALQGETKNQTPDYINSITTFNLINSTQLLCSPTYGINRAMVTTNGTSQLPAKVDLLPQSQSRTLGNVTGIDLVNTFYAVSPKVYMNGEQGGIFGDILENPFDGLLGYAVSQAGNPSLTDFMVPGTLVDVSNSYFRAVTTQIAKLALLEEDNTSTTGTLWHFENRLVPRVLSIRAIEALLVLLLFFAIAMIFLVPELGTTILDPDSIGGLGVLISKSADLKIALTGLGLSPLSIISDRLSASKYHTTAAFEGSQYIFEVQQSEQLLQDVPSNRKSRSPSSQLAAIVLWRPFGATVYAKIFGDIMRHNYWDCT
jgi:hypothetical protein